MKLDALKQIRFALNKSYQKEKVLQADFDHFKYQLQIFIQNVDLSESEEHAKNNIKAFLNDTFYKSKREINTKGRTDLVIHTDKSTKSKVAVMIETKKPGITAMPKPSNLNTKAFQQLILYYFQERKAGNLEIKHLIITDAYQWFIFEESQFEKLFYQNNKLKQQFEAWEKSGKNTDVFYKNVAEPFLKDATENIQGLFFDLKKDYVPLCQKDNEPAKRKLMSLYKLFSLNHLLREYSYDSNH